MQTNLASQVDTKCGTDVPQALYEALRQQVPIIEEFAAAQAATNSTTPKQVPIRFTNVLDNLGGGSVATQSDITACLSYLNNAYSGTGLSFIQCGALNSIHRTELYGNADIDNFLTDFAYASGTLEMYIKLGGSLNPYAPLPCPDAYNGGNPNFNVPCFTHDNFVSLQIKEQMQNSTVAHEVGHHFGLLHTFFRPYTYHTPVVYGQLDHPYIDQAIDPITNQVYPEWWGRELVIRVDEPANSPKPFKVVNFDNTGDLIRDTPADCFYSNTFPDPANLSVTGCPSIVQLGDCSMNASAMKYRDYNNDPLLPAPAGMTLGRNFMSYWRTDCVNEFTPLQKSTRINYFYETYRAPRYMPDRCGNFTDRIEFQGTNIPMPTTTARVRHPNNTRKCNITTSPVGDFSGILHNDYMTSAVYHNGLKSDLVSANDPIKKHYDHTYCEWVRGVNTADLILIQKYILGFATIPSGYSKIAADANHGNTITTFDIVELRKLLLGVYQKLPNHDQPFRFTPEVIPADFSASFNANPFSVMVNNTNIGSSYLEPLGWQYFIPGTGKRGFDAIKIGDVNSTWPGVTPCTTELTSGGDSEQPPFFVPGNSIGPGKTLALKFRANNFQQIEGFQLSIRLPKDKFEVINITSPANLGGYTVQDNFSPIEVHQQEDLVKTLWFSSNGSFQNLSNNSDLFTITVKTLQSIENLQNDLTLDNGPVESKFWAISPVVTSIDVNVEEITDPREGKEARIAQENNLRVFPNPFGNNLQVVYDHGQSATEALLNVFDMRGQLVFQQTVSIESGRNIIPIQALSEYPQGMYNITLNINGQTFMAKSLKK